MKSLKQAEIAENIEFDSEFEDIGVIGKTNFESDTLVSIAQDCVKNIINTQDFSDQLIEDLKPERMKDSINTLFNELTTQVCSAFAV